MALARSRARRSLGSIGTGLPAVVGFFRGTSGIALSAQLASLALEQLGIEHRRVEVGDLATPTIPDDLSSSAWIFHLNAPELMILLRAWGPERVAGPRYGFWAWELPRAPAAWIRTSKILDGLIVPSQFTAEAFGGADRPITVTPHPFVAAEFDRVVRDRTRPMGETFRTVMLFDFRSAMARKNPQGAIRAFANAFGEDPDVRLIVKTSNPSFAPELRRAVQERAGPNVDIVDGVWPRERLLSFIASADALLSLHRSEGFGLTMAEAMMLGVPVVATAWSGNLQFMDDDTACLVPAALIPVEDPQDVYRGQIWAAPDEVVASHHLRRLRSDAAFAFALGERAKLAVRDKLSPEKWFATLPKNLQATLYSSPVKSGV
jgi:glycosyltransferase involved in cell wall biosynthesis